MNQAAAGNTIEVPGVILTRQMQDTADGLTYIFWIATADGPIKAQQTQQEAVFFVENIALPKVRNLLSAGKYREKALPLKSFNQQAVSALYFRDYRDLRQAASLLQKHQIEPLEYDVRPVDRYLMERFITGSVLLDLPTDLQKEAQNIRMRTTRRKKTSDADDRLMPSLKVVSFDIETSMVGDHLYAIAVHCTQHDGLGRSGAMDSARQYDAKSQVFMLGQGEKISDVPLLYCPTERSLITQFLDWVQAEDPDILIGWNCINFDLRFLERKCQSLGMPFTIGRGSAVAQWRSSANNNQHFVLVPGRAVLDGIDTLKTATYQLESFSLENVAQALLKRGKLIHDPHDRGQEITRLFNEDKPSLARYNLEDCVLVWDIFKKTELIQFALQRSTVTGLPLDKIGGSVLAFENLYLPRLHRQGYVAPNLPQNPQGVGSPGGYVMDSLPGLYDSVLVFDFKSLYPSIIRTFHVDPYALAEGDAYKTKKKNTPTTGVEQASFQQGSEDYIDGFRGATFRISCSILPDLIEEIWQARDIAKNQNNAPLSQALKIIMNSFYGVMGTPGCRFFDARLPSSITLRGHEILMQTRRLLEAEGYSVIYGDTDSIFVLAKRPLLPHEADVTGAKLAHKLNSWWQDHILQTYGVTSALELEYETHYSRFVMPRIRGSMEGTKKRYAGLVCKPGFDIENPQEDSYELVFKGLETVRTDWTQAARSFQKQLYRLVFLNQPWKDFVTQTITALRAGELDNSLVFRKRLRRKLMDYQKNIPPHAQAAFKADQWLRQQGLPEQYQQGGWIEYCYTVNGPEPLERLVSPLDYETYIEKQIAPIVDGIACFLEENGTDLTSNQLSLL